MTIYTVARNVFFEATRKWALENNNSRVEIEDATDINDNVLTVKVNWASIGAVSPDEAVKFADALNAAAAVAKAVNDLRLGINYKLYDDPWIVCREDCEWAKEFLSGLISTGDLERLTAWLTMHSED